MVIVGLKLIYMMNLSGLDIQKNVKNENKRIQDERLSPYTYLTSLLIANEKRKIRVN